MRRVVILSCFVLIGGLLGPSAASASGGGHGSGEADLTWIAVEEANADVLPDGTTFDEENPPPEEGEPPVGTRFFIQEALYATDDGETRGEQVGDSYIECTVQVVTTVVLCDIAFVLDEGSQLHGTVQVDFSTFEEDDVFAFDIAVTGGTGEFAEAEGTVTLTDISEDPEGDTITRYEVTLDD